MSAWLGMMRSFLMRTDRLRNMSLKKNITGSSPSHDLTGSSHKSDGTTLAHRELSSTTAPEEHWHCRERAVNQLRHFSFKPSKILRNMSSRSSIKMFLSHVFNGISHKYPQPTGALSMPQLPHLKGFHCRAHSTRPSMTTPH